MTYQNLISGKIRKSISVSAENVTQSAKCLDLTRLMTEMAETKL